MRFGLSTALGECRQKSRAPPLIQYTLILSPLECFGKSFNIIIYFPRVMAVYFLHTSYLGYITTASKMPHWDLGWGNLPVCMYRIPGIAARLPDFEIHVRVKPVESHWNPASDSVAGIPGIPGSQDLQTSIKQVVPVLLNLKFCY